jgi:hypothetical protein
MEKVNGYYCNYDQQQDEDLKPRNNIYGNFTDNNFNEFFLVGVKIKIVDVEGECGFIHSKPWSIVPGNGIID